MQLLPHRKLCVSIAETKPLTLFGDIIAVYSENHMKLIRMFSKQDAKTLNDRESDT